MQFHLRTHVDLAVALHFCDQSLLPEKQEAPIDTINF